MAKSISKAAKAVEPRFVVQIWHLIKAIKDTPAKGQTIGALLDLMVYMTKILGKPQNFKLAVKNFHHVIEGLGPAKFLEVVGSAQSGKAVLQGLDGMAGKITDAHLRMTRQGETVSHVFQRIGRGAYGPDDTVSSTWDATKSVEQFTSLFRIFSDQGHPETAQMVVDAS